ncbi:Piwi-domain-containing protein [Cryphonectria parasitica EP155]|uniref:Piwi-domain-containing protein n=1 Tax=Cryphonectria parasitica (strain ATCC 38755 / EP155) TaxID=660469 RepID=A0A9P5CL86_CRYP1|nr:Piwi-domain-containing protein [Cryphonectria parasitica EP155]KAF3763069.1 Piwi-domain-containing protein [Cryphonectria parasitica EP155]
MGYPPALGYDPARDEPELSTAEQHRLRVNKRVDLPPEAFPHVSSQMHPFAQRPQLGTLGKKVQLRVNQFRLVGVPAFDIYQYDVSVTPEPKKAAFCNAVWNTRLAQEHIRKAGPHPWIFDGQKIAWSRNPSPEIRIQINMDEERGRAPKAGRTPDVVYLVVKRTTTVRLDALRAYLKGQMGWDDHVLECLNFLDHLFREWPRQNLVAIKRNFYSDDAPERYLLDDTHRHIEAIKGIYASIRTNSSIRSGGMGLGINVDVANTAFWSGGATFLELCTAYLRSSRREYIQLRDYDLGKALAPVEYPNGQLGQSPMWKMLRRMSKLSFSVKHRGKMNDVKPYKIKGFVWDLKKFPQGANARNYKFEKDGQSISVEEYFRQRYDIKLKAWYMPLIETTRDGVFPMETITIDKFQRYNFKLDGEQTSKMIKFAVTKPPVRQSGVMNCVKTLRWREDPYLKSFGIQIKGEMEAIEARVLPNPVIQFAKSSTDPSTSGRWDLRNQIFTMPNPRPLNAWAVVIVNNCVQEPSVKNFISTFVKVYRGHGGKVTTPFPPIKPLKLVRTEETGNMMVDIYNSVGRQFQQSPDLIFYIMPSKDIVAYERLKKSMDVRVGTLSQIVLAPHVMKAAPQYCSNVATKVNAKLGGYTSKLKEGGFFKVPTMILGADISHGSFGQTGNLQASLAAITMSMDPDAITYAAGCETNGYRVEIMTKDTVRRILPPMVTRWCQKMRTAPQHVFYFRDGVSEGEFQQVLDYEIQEVRSILQEVGQRNPKITVIVGTKRHHIRFFPIKGSDGDRNGNPFPGTVVEREVTHPFHYDFYLNSHVAIQGTARPVHYQVLVDEVGMPVDALQRMIYHQCYQYVRSTTPVSLHPAIYYAHLAAARGRAHEDIDASEKDPQNRLEEMRLPLAKHDNKSVNSSKKLEKAPYLMEIGADKKLARADNINFFKGTMWFV